MSSSTESAETHRSATRIRPQPLASCGKDGKEIPFELIDLIGVDTELRVMQSMFEEMGETFRPSPLLKTMVAAGHLGRKSGRGFYVYEKAC